MVGGDATMGFAGGADVGAKETTEAGGDEVFEGSALATALVFGPVAGGGVATAVGGVDV